MTEIGIVTRCKNNYAEVRIGRNSACATCGKCGMTENQKHVDFFVENTQGAKEGDMVELCIPDDVKTTPLALVAYIMPLVPALALMFTAFALALPEWAALLMFVGGFAIGICVLVLIERLRKHKWAQLPTMVSVIPNVVKPAPRVQAGEEKSENKENENE